MRIESLRFQADLCRSQASLFSKRPEGRILKRMADSFNELAADQSRNEALGKEPASFLMPPSQREAPRDIAR